MMGRMVMAMSRLGWFWNRHILKIQIDSKLEGGFPIVYGKEKRSLAGSSMSQVDDGFIQLGMEEIVKTQPNSTQLKLV